MTQIVDMLNKVTEQSVHERRAKTTAIQEMERALEASKQELADLRAEFNGYKIRAHAALQKSSGPNIHESRIQELESEKRALERDLMSRTSEIAQFSLRVQSLQTELSTASDQINSMEVEMDRLQSKVLEVHRLREQLEDAERKARIERDMHQEALRLKDAQVQPLLEATRVEVRKQYNEMEEKLRSKEDQIQSLNAISERLSNDLSSVREELSKALAETQSLRIVADVHRSSSNNDSKSPFISSPPVNPFTAVSSRTTSGYPLDDSGSHSTDATSPRASTTYFNLQTAQFVPTVDVTPTGPTFREREFSMQLHQLSELLSESDRTNQRLAEQEKILKEEIRRLQRSESLEKTLNLEYLRNVIVAFLETSLSNPNRDAKQREKDLMSLVPVVSQILQLSENEIARLRTVIQKATAEAPHSSFFGIL
ncbi:hypothetical protein BJ742DRAFT_459488 [Cladochytrium replicatum]|nr:hypothetical protein BJ742DRAFT_459488 [Cladochytrium replicatum]